MNQAILEAKAHANQINGNTDLTVSSDATWMTRGRRSNVGVTTFIAAFTNKVIGVDIRHKKCRMCMGKKIVH